MGGLPRQLAELHGRAGRRRGRLRAAALGVALAACAPAPSPAPSLVTVSDGRYAMGTVLELSVRVSGEAEGRALLEELYGTVGALEAELSTWQPASAISALNAGAGGPARPVPPALARILRESLELCASTEGAFDVSVGPLVALWKEAARSGRAPSAQEIRAARALLGGLELRGGTARLASAGSALDLAGIAKGFALDRLAERLRAAGVEHALLSFGESSVVALGAPDDGERWRLLLRGPGDGYAGVIALRDQALSVSASFPGDEPSAAARIGHLIDPRRGVPVSEDRVGVALAPSAAQAEAWSKALVVLGARGVELAETAEGVEGMLLEAAAPRRVTSGFADAARLPAPPR